MTKKFELELELEFLSEGGYFITNFSICEIVVKRNLQYQIQLGSIQNPTEKI